MSSNYPYFVFTIYGYFTKLEYTVLLGAFGFLTTNLYISQRGTKCPDLLNIGICILKSSLVARCRESLFFARLL